MTPAPFRPRRLLAASAMASLTLTAGIAATSPSMRTIWDGIYTDAQATTGAAKYAQQCARCHGAELAGTAEIPSLRGQLITRWAGTSLDGLSGYLNRAMPLQSPGALPPETNAAILAFILKVDGAPAGTLPLASDPAALKAIAVTAEPKSLSAAAER